MVKYLMTIALIVPVLRRFDLFTELIHSVDYPIYPIVMDNWNHNRGVSSAWNDGMVIAKKNKFDYAIISNDDVLFEKDTIKKLHEKIITGDHVIVGADEERDREPDGLVESACFSCFAVNINKLILKCGYFDENFHPAYFEDNDMAYRIKLAGLSMKTDTGAKIFHHGSATQNPDRSNTIDNWAVKPDQFEKNKAYYVKKWGGMPGEEKFSTPFNDPNLTLKDW